VRVGGGGTFIDTKDSLPIQYNTSIHSEKKVRKAKLDKIDKEKGEKRINGEEI